MTRELWLLAVSISLSACAPAGKTSSETHFVICAKDVDCTNELGAGFACSAGRCQTTGSTVADARPRASSGRPDAGNAAPAPPRCGDGVCSNGETSQSCPQDCAYCGNGACEANENQFSCPNDCAFFCGDGHCDGNETRSTCPTDCGSPDGGPFPVRSGPQDASAGDVGVGVCGDGMCSPSEDQFSCSVDCGYCGNGLCESNETKESCPADCASRP